MWYAMATTLSRASLNVRLDTGYQSYLRENCTLGATRFHFSRRLKPF